ncbi:MAG: VTT domain-containing protein [Candidatus Moraniibacteriota bacterium]
MNFFSTIEHWVRIYATVVPLEWFVFIGSFFEEVVSPIPSALIMGTAGSLALVQGSTLWYLVWLALIGNLGKTLGAWLYYVVGDKLEDFLVRPLAQYFGVTHEEIESIGKRFTGHHLKDGGAVFLLRVLPFVPSLPVSLAAGIIKMDVRVYLAATYAGNFFKDLFYLYVGYMGLAKLHTLWRAIEPVKFAVDILVGIGIIAFLMFLYVHRGAGQRFLQYSNGHLRAALERLFRRRRP